MFSKEKNLCCFYAQHVFKLDKMYLMIYDLVDRYCTLQYMDLSWGHILSKVLSLLPPLVGRTIFYVFLKYQEYIFLLFKGVGGGGTV